MAPSTKIHQEEAKRSLCTFTQQWIENLSINSSVDNYLRESPPFDFWQFYLEYLCFRTRKATKSDDESAKGLSIETVRRRMSQALSFMKQRYQVCPSASDVKKLWTILYQPEFQKQNNLQSAQFKPWANFDTCKTVIQYGVFGNCHIFKNARERLQMSALLLTLAYTAARPGEIVCSHGYETGLTYGDLTFYAEKLPNGETTICVDVKICHMKSMRGTNNYRIQHLYQQPESLPPMFDAALQLAILALTDHVFEDFETTEEIFAFDPEDFARQIYANSTISKVELKIKPEKIDIPVFRRFEFQNHRWVTSSTSIWCYVRANEILAHIKAKLGLHDFEFYTLRRLCATVLNNWMITESDAQLILGHKMGTSTYESNYVSKRTMFDIQGLFSTGTEKRERLAFDTLERIPQVPLSIDEKENIENNPELSAAKAKYIEVLFVDSLPKKHSSNSWHLQNQDLVFQANRQELSTFNILKASSLSLNVHVFSRSTEMSTLLKEALTALKNERGAIARLRTLLRMRARERKSKQSRQTTRSNIIRESLTVNEIIDDMDDFEQPEDESDVQDIPEEMERMSHQENMDDDETNEGQQVGQDDIAARESLQLIKNRHQHLLEPRPNFNELSCIHEDVTTAAAEAFYSLTSGWETKTTPILEQCPTCKRSASIVQQPNLGLSHYVKCTKSVIFEDIKQAIEDNLIAKTVCQTAVIFCEEHLEWCIGRTQANDHFVQHLNKSLEHMSQDEIQHVCPYCWNNQSKDPFERAKIYCETSSVRRHIISCHLLELTGPVDTCPVCNQRCLLALLPDHLIDHGYYLAGHSDISDIPRRCNGDLQVLKYATTARLHRRLTAWIESIDSLD
jgi:hypothetical protein